jgi:YesN/AraC family two-component response regulator
MPTPVNANAILYVEDDEMVRMATTLILKMKYPQFNLLSAVNGKEGLEIFRLNRPAIVITDIVMPLMDGLQMVKEIKTIVSGVQIIVTSADNDMGKITAAINIDSGSYVRKPFSPGSLFAAIDDCIYRMTFTLNSKQLHPAAAGQK